MSNNLVYTDGSGEAIYSDEPGHTTVDNATTGDELLTALADVPAVFRSTKLSVCGIKILREAADLCGIDSTDMDKRAAVKAIMENF